MVQLVRRPQRLLLLLEAAFSAYPPSRVLPPMLHLQLPRDLFLEVVYLVLHMQHNLQQVLQLLRVVSHLFYV